MPTSRKPRGVRSGATKTSQVEKLGARVPPHNLETERALLCALLIDAAAFSRVVGIIEADSFYDPRHSAVFNSMTRLFASATPIDALTVSDDLSRNDELETIGGDPFLAGLTTEEATSAHVEHYAEIIQEKATLRRLITSASTAVNDAFDAVSSHEILEQTMKALFDVYSRRQRGGLQPLSQILHDAHEYLDKHYHTDGQLTGIGTGFPNLDIMTSGFQHGDFIIIAARPSMGKTALSLDLARHAAMKHGASVAYFSLEMASMAIAMRLLASEARINLHRLRSGKSSDAELQRIVQASERLSNLKIFIDDSGTLGLMELRARARQLKQQQDIDIIFVDYLQLMKPPKAESREQEVAQISRALKGLARELDVPVVAMSQLSRAVEHRGGDKRPQLADLRDSGAIEQDADVVMFISRDDRNKANEQDQDVRVNPEVVESEVSIRKQRNGPTGSIKFNFISTYARFEEAADAGAQQAAQYAGASADSQNATSEDAPF